MVFLTLACISFATSLAQADDWPEFRGPLQNGIAENATPPLNWSQDKNIVWRQEMPGEGWSSPVVYKGSVYLTTALIDEEKKPTSLRVLRVDAATGDILWNAEAITWSGESTKHVKNGYASPTPIVYDDRVYVHFGPRATACLDTEGKVLWRQMDLAYIVRHGSGGSPVLHDNKLIFTCDDLTTPFIVALDVKSGNVIWRTDRETTARNKDSFCTPIIINDKKRKLVVSPGAGMVGAYDVEDGKEVWHVRYGNGFSVVPRPLVAHGMIFMATGTNGVGVMAVRPGGRGDVTDTHVVWEKFEGWPETPSMLIIGDELYYVSDKGEFSCVDAVTGELHWRERIRGRITASPVYAKGRIYTTTERGKTVVVKASKEYKILAENNLFEDILASLALSGSAVFIRTEDALYRIEKTEVTNQ
jgi:outer membrane protein assembly factor BamB